MRLLTWIAGDMMGTSASPSPTLLILAGGAVFLSDVFTNTDTSGFWLGLIPDNYGGGNTALKVYWRAAEAANYNLQARIVGRGNGEVIDASLGSYVSQTITPTALGDLQITNVSFPVATYPLSPADLAVVQVRRDGGDAGDAATAGLQFIALILEEV